MASFSFEDSKGQFDNRFVVLGQDWDGLNARKKRRINRKINRDSDRKTKFSWGTLGWASKDSKSFDVKGKLAFSGTGRDENASGSTLEEIKTIYQFNDQLGPDSKVRERYINFDNVEFGFKKDKFTVDELPELRLTLFVNKGEGAIVFYQHNTFGEKNGKDAEVMYIHPQPTKKHSSERDRLDYIFPIMPGKVSPDSTAPQKLVKENGKPDTSFVVKVLTFKRRVKVAQNLYNEGLKHLNKSSIPGKVLYNLVGKKKYGLLKFNKTTGKFDAVSKSQIDKSARTLIFVHGTFKSVGVTYADLIAHNNARMIKDLITNKVFDQILGFDHPTISHDIFQNSKWLYGELGTGKFDQAVSLIGVSRGGLLTRWLASDSSNKCFAVREIINFSPANGVDYFTLGKHINTMLKVLKKGAGPGAKVITMLAQFSIEFFLKQPGVIQMTPGSKRLQRVLATKPKKLRYLAMAADWDKSLVKDKALHKRVVNIVVDSITKLILGKENDWVVGTKNQRISPDGALKPCNFKSMHTSSFVPAFPKLNGKPFDTHKYIYDFFER